MELIPSNKGKNNLSYKGFLYEQHSLNKGRTIIYWRCVERKICNARMHTTADEENLEVVKDGTDNHVNHLPDHRGIEVKRRMQSLKRRAEAHPNEPPQQVMRATVAEVQDPVVLDRLPQRNTMRRLVNAHQNRGRPRVPQSLSDIIIDPPYSLTHRNSSFLLFDSGEDDPDGLVVFCSSESFRVLCRSDLVHADGTFKTVPSEFGQLYTIHGSVEDVEEKKHLFPLVFCLSVRKDEGTYRRIYQVLKDEAERLNLTFSPPKFMTDFELAAMNAQQAAFPASESKGCLFHFNQALWRQVVDKGLRVMYVNAENEDHTVRKDIQRLMALPFVPLEDVEEVFDAIVEVADERVEGFASYVEDTYIRGRRILRGRRIVPPRFPPRVWNMYNEATNNSHRTNNAVEGYHSKFQKLLVVSHASIWKFLDALRDEEHDFHQIYDQIRAGHVQVRPPQSKKYVQNQEMIQRLARAYGRYKQRGDTMKYLEAISYRLKINAS